MPIGRPLRLVEALPQPCLTVLPAVDADGTLVDVASTTSTRGLPRCSAATTTRLHGPELRTPVRSLAPELLLICREGCPASTTESRRPRHVDGDARRPARRARSRFGDARVLDDVTCEASAPSERSRRCSTLLPARRPRSPTSSSRAAPGRRSTDLAVGARPAGWDTPEEVVGGPGRPVVEEDHPVQQARDELGRRIDRATRPASCVATARRSGSRSMSACCAATGGRRPVRLVARCSPSTRLPTCCGSAPCTTRSPG